MPLQPDTVAIPVTKGVNLTSEARLIDPPYLLEATNARFTRGGGSRKRRGHAKVLARSALPIPPGIPSTTTTDSNWVFGWGYNLGNRSSAADTVVCGVSSHPNAGRLYGLAQRDQETMLWTGHSLLSYSPGESTDPESISATIGNAVIPSLRSFPIAKVQTSQIAPDIADNGVIKVVAWIDAGTGLAKYSLYDSVSGALLVANSTLPAVTPYQVRTVPLGNHVHILVSDTADFILKVYSIHQEIPTAAPTFRSYGDCNKYFGIYKISEAVAGIVRSDTGTRAVAVSWMGQDGSAYTGSTYAAFSVPLANAPDVVAMCVHPVTGDVSVAWQIVGSIVYGSFNTAGALLHPIFTVATPTTARRLTMAPKYIQASNGNSLVDIYWDGASNTVNKQRVNHLSVLGTLLTRYNLTLASAAFRVGDRTYVWLGHPSSLQGTWFLADEGLDPVGHQDWGQARAATNGAGAGIESGLTVSHLSSVNWTSTVFSTPNGSASPLVNTTLFHLGLGYNTRVPTSSVNTAVFAEPSIKETRLNFLPTFRTAQAGRAMYIAGAQVWSYDGSEITEAGFHVGPEVPAPTAVGPLGSLTALGTYFYRVDVCYKNAQGEEIRSLSIITPTVTLTGSQRTLTLTIPTCYTRRKNSYFLIFRNAMSSGVPLTNLWLLNSRDPTSPHFITNDQSVASVTFVDDGTLFSDTTIQNNELHPANSGNVYVQPVAAPACEIISSGRDRVWVAGGELLPGQVAPSRLFDPGDVPSWNPYLAIQVDRSAEPLTAVGFVGEVAVFFRKNATYVMDGDGPDNVANGVWAPARLAFADLGALGQESLGLISQGLLFQGPAGIRLMGPGGNLAPVGAVTDEYVKTFQVLSTVVVDHDQEVRWYGPTGALVYNYQYDTWSTWTITGTGAVRDLSTGLVLLARADGNLMVETDGVWTDGGTPYTHRIRFPWLHAGNLGDFQRVKSIEGVGTWNPTDGAHAVRIELYYDEREFAEEWFEFSVPDTNDNADTWGANTWGAGVWGDTNAVGGGISDTTWDWKRKPARQKCAVMSIAIEDKGTAGPGFTLNAICLRLGRKAGLNRIPSITGGSDNYR